MLKSVGKLIQLPPRQAQLQSRFAPVREGALDTAQNLIGPHSRNPDKFLLSLAVPVARLRCGVE